MNRRNCLLTTAGLFGLGSGCVDFVGGGTRDPIPETPTGTFDAIDRSEYWTVDLQGTSPTVETRDALYVSTESTWARFNPDGTQEWSVPLEGSTHSLSASGDTIYGDADDGLSGDSLVARDARTGSLRWEQSIEDHASVFGTTPEGVFLGTSGEEGPVDGHYPAFGLDADTGDQRWRTEVGTERGAAVSHGLCLIWTTDTIYALDAESGDIRWERSPGYSENASPMVVGDTVVLAANGVTAYALPDGAKQWEYSNVAEVELVMAPGQNANRPAHLYVGDAAGRLMQLDVATGEEQWRIDRTHWGDRWGVHDVTLANGSAVTRINDGLASFDADDGTQEWAISLGQVHLATRELFTNDELVYVGREAAPEEIYVETFDLATGQRQWLLPIENEGSLGSYGVADGTFVITTTDGRIYGFPHSL